MPRSPRDILPPSRSDTREASSDALSGSSRSFDPIRHAAQDSTAFSSPRPKPAFRAMSPGDSIYDLSPSRTRQRRNFLQGSAKYAPDGTQRPPANQLTRFDLRQLTRTDHTFSRIRDWESFTDPAIQNRQHLDQAKSAHRSAATRKGNATRGLEGRSEAVKKGKKTLGFEGRSEAVKKGKDAMGQQARSEAARKANVTRGPEVIRDSTRKAREAKVRETKEFNKKYGDWVDLDML